MRCPPALVLTDRSQLPLGRSLAATVEAVVAAGLDHVVLRELDLPDLQRAGLAADLRAVGATVIAAHRPVPGCVAVHRPADPARMPAEPGAFGQSCHSAEEVRRAAAAGASYATLGPYAATPSKPAYGPSLPPTQYAALPIPTYALGGVTPGNARAAVGTGAHGIAVMGAVMRADAPEAVAAALMEVLS